MKSKKSINEKTIEANNHILFDGKMRKLFVEGVFQDIKGYFEHETNGKVEVMYEDFNLKNYEFGFKLKATKTKDCKKQMFVEVTSSIVNIVGYMFRGDSEQYDVTFTANDDCLEVEFVSNW